MNIALVSDSIYPYNKGGKEKRIFEITTRLLKHGHNVTIYTMKWWDGPDIIHENGIKLIAIGKLKNLYTNERRRSLTEALYFGYKSFSPLLKANYDILIADHIPYLQLFSLKLTTILKKQILIADWLEVWGRKNWINYLGILKGNLAYLIEYFSVKMPNYIFSISGFTTKRLISELQVPKSKIVTIPCGIDLNQINQAVNKNQLVSDCIFIGRLLNHKNVDVLIKAIKIVKNNLKKNIKCYIIGDGPEKDNLEALTKQLSLEENIIFCGFLKNHIDVYSYLKSSKIFTFPSTREGFGIVVLEANACGLPVIGVKSDFNASADLIKNDNNGYLVNLSSEEIANKIIYILKNNELQNKLKEKSKNFAKEYSWNIIAKAANEQYSKIFSKMHHE